MPSSVLRCECLALPRGTFGVWLQQLAWADPSWSGAGTHGSSREASHGICGTSLSPGLCWQLWGGQVKLAECWLCRAGVTGPSWDLCRGLHRTSSTLCQGSQQEQPYVFLQHCELKSALCSDLCGPYKQLPLRAVFQAAPQPGPFSSSCSLLGSWCIFP